LITKGFPVGRIEQLQTDLVLEKYSGTANCHFKMTLDFLSQVVKEVFLQQSKLLSIEAVDAFLGCQESPSVDLGVVKVDDSAELVEAV
jgi:hypothetical protein